MKSFVFLVAFAVSAATLKAESPQTFGYVLQADTLASSKSAAVAKLAKSGRDWLVLDANFNDDSPWLQSDLDAIRDGLPNRQIIAYISIGEAEEYCWYWQRAWGSKGQLTAAAPAWLGGENRKWKGNYRVQYWDPTWQALILQSVDRAMATGFDGVYLDIVDGFENFEKVGSRYVDDKVNDVTQQSFRRDMVDWVKRISTQVRRAKPNAFVVPQNASQLLAHADYLELVSAVGIEDLYTNDNIPQPKSHTKFITENLQPILAKGLPVLVIEYPTKPAFQKLAVKGALKDGFTLLLTDRELKTLGIVGSHPQQ